MSEGIPQLLASRTLALTSVDGENCVPPVALLPVKRDADAQTLRVTVRDKASERQRSVYFPAKETAGAIIMAQTLCLPRRDSSPGATHSRLRRARDARFWSLLARDA